MEPSVKDLLVEDLWRGLFAKLDLKSQIYLVSTCKYLLTNSYIENLHDVEDYYLKLLTDDILSQSKFFNVTRLRLCFGSKVSNMGILCLKKLSVLTICGFGHIIDQNAIDQLNLVELDVANNSDIKYVGHMTKLKILDASGNCGIKQDSIDKLNLRVLCADDNSRITRVSHMELEELSIEGKSGVSQEEISKLTSLKKLNANSNPNVKKISHMSNLKILYAAGNCGINAAEITGLKLDTCYKHRNQNFPNASTSIQYYYREIIFSNMIPGGDIYYEDGIKTNKFFVDGRAIVQSNHIEITEISMANIIMEKKIIKFNFDPNNKSSLKFKTFIQKIDSWASSKNVRKQIFGFENINTYQYKSLIENYYNHDNNRPIDYVEMSSYGDLRIQINNDTTMTRYLLSKLDYYLKSATGFTLVFVIKFFWTGSEKNPIEVSDYESNCSEEENGISDAEFIGEEDNESEDNEPDENSSESNNFIKQQIEPNITSYGVELEIEAIKIHTKK